MNINLIKRHLVVFIVLAISIVLVILLKLYPVREFESHRRTAPQIPVELNETFTIKPEELLESLENAWTAKIAVFTGKDEYVVLETANCSAVASLIRGIGEWDPLGEVNDPRFPTLVGSAKFIAFSHYSAGKDHGLSQSAVVFHVKLTPGLMDQVMKYMTTELKNEK